MLSRSKDAVVCSTVSRYRLSIWPAVVLLALWVGLCLPARGQSPPTITSISPATVSAGGAYFTLTVVGSNYRINSVVQMNGSNRQTVYVSGVELTATILASDITTPGKQSVTVLNTNAGVSQVSNAVLLNVVGTASPTLTSASPAFSAQGVSQGTMTLVGTNFRPGATVVISPPLASVSSSNGHTRASDISVLSTTVVNANVMTAVVSVNPNAVPGLRAVDVLNLDGTSTVDTTTASPQGSSQPLEVSASNSIGAPLSVLNMAMMHPRDGTVVMQGDALDAEAILGGTGTGTVIGQWVWDGNVVEQFSAKIVGGQSTSIRTEQPLPTWLLGSHTLQLRMLEPNQITSHPVEVVVNPGDWKLEELIQPGYGAVYSENVAPHLLWAAVPGAMKYQVGFSSKPFFNTIEEWFDVTENHWQVPDKVWSGLPTGQLYWTVRTVDASGQARKALPMRVIYRSAKKIATGAEARLSGRVHLVLASFDVRSANPSAVAGISSLLQGDSDTPAVTPATKVATATNDAEAPPAATSTKARSAGPAENGQIGLNTQWASGSNPADSNALSAAEHLLHQQGPWNIEVNGSGLLNSILNPEVQRTSLGKVNDYVFQIGYQRKEWQPKGWGANLRFGILSPVLYTDAQYVSQAMARQGLEVTLKTPLGAFSSYTNTEDTAAGGGAGIAVQQRIVGASWQAPLPQWAQFRLMWLSATDMGAASAAGEVYGALVNLHLPKKWFWVTEYAVSHDNPATASSSSTRAFGRAWRTGITGQPGKAKISIAYRDVTANFGNPINPGLTPNSQPNVRGVDTAVSESTKAGTFGVNYTFLANNIHPTISDELYLNTFEETWSKPVRGKTNLALDMHQSLTRTGKVPAALLGKAPSVTGAADTRDLSGSLSLSKQFGKDTLTLGGQRDWSHNTLLPATNTITSSLNAGSNLATQGFFQLTSQVSVSWLVANGLTTGTTRSASLNLQPTCVWKKPTLQIAPLITVAESKTTLSSGTRTSDTLTGQYGGRVTWTLPGAMKFSTFSAQGSYNQNRNSVTGTDHPSTQLLVIWTTVWNHKHTF
jgi:hypothetical protein